LARQRCAGLTRFSPNPGAMSIRGVA
jgi:hypothetical protein